MRRVFEDFMALGYIEGNNPWKTKVKDISLGNLIVLRQGRRGISVNYLYDGSRLLIPFAWHDLWQSFYVHSGNRILFQNEENALQEDSLPYVERMILLNTKFQQLLAIKGPGKDILDILGDICTLGTGEFRKTYNLKIEPFKYTSLRMELKI